MIRPAGKLAVATFVATAGLVCAGPAVAASVNSFSARPAEFNPKIPATRAYFKPSIAKGGTYSGHVIVTNSSAASVTLAVDSVQGLTGATSGTVYANRQDPKRGSARWVTPDVPRLRLPAHRSMKVGFKVRVPSDAWAGDHVAGLALQNAHPPRSSGKFSVTEIVRVVVGVDVHVAGPARRRLAVTSVALKPLGQSAAPSALITTGDVGGLPCQPTLAVTLDGPHGTQQVTRKLDTVLPGNVISYPLPWPRSLPAGRYTARVRGSHCGPTVTYRTSARLGHPLTSRAAPSASAKPAPAALGQRWWVIALVGLGGVALGILVSRRRQAPVSPSN